MTQIFHLPQEIRQEFSIDQNGVAYASQRAISRLAGVSQEAVRKLLLKISDNLEVPEIFKSFAGKELKGDNLNDVLVALIVEYYAFDAGRYCTDQAKLVFRSFGAMGLRTWAQNELGWQKPKPKNPDSRFAEDLMLADFAAKSAMNAGVDPEIAEQIKLDSLMKVYPERQALLISQKNAIAASKPLPELPMNPTEIGEKLAVILGYVKISAKKVNSKLLELGYQVSVTRIKKSNGKEVHHYYQATEKGKNHSQIQMTAYTQGEGKSTKPQLKWFSSIVQILANNWEEN